MKKALLFAALLSTSALAGCTTTFSTGVGNAAAALSADITAGATAVKTSLLAINQGLVAAAPSVESVVSDIGVAIGYANDLASAGLLPKASVTELNKSAAVVNAIANNPPSSIGGVVDALAAAKTNIQNLSQQPSPVVATVVTVAIPATPVSPAVPATVVTIPATIPANPAVVAPAPAAPAAPASGS